jgi:hypothetical protein
VSAYTDKQARTGRKTAPAARLINGISTPPGRCIVRMSLAAAWHRQHRESRPGSTHPSRVPRTPHLETGPARSIAISIRRSGNLARQSYRPLPPPIRLTTSLSGAHRSTGGNAGCPDQPSIASGQTKARPGSRNPGRAFDPPVHPRSGRWEQNKRTDAGLRLDRSTLETPRHVTSLGRA